MDCVDTAQHGLEDLSSAMGRMHLNNLNNNNTDIAMVDGDVNMESMETTETDMTSEAVRLSTFTNWPHYAPVMPTALARAGFFYVGRQDIVECFSCKVRIQDWELGDTAMGEHKKLSPSCLFVQGKETRNKQLLVPPKRQESTPRQPRNQVLLSPNQMESGSEKAQQQLACALEHELQITEKRAVAPQNENSRLDNERRPMASEEKRLLTFVSWPKNSPVHPEDLAKAGFYFIGSDDTVQCFACRGTLGKWRDTDVPMSEHREHFPMCPFVLGVNCGNEPMRQDNGGAERTLKLPVRVSEGGEEENISAEILANHHSSAQAQTACVSPEPCNIVLGPSAHSEYKEVKRRLSTYHTWPANANARPDALAQAGFFYTGIGDNVKCFHCDGGLRNWEPTDEPWAEHAKWFPRCKYLLKKRGQPYVDFVNSTQNVCVPEQTRPNYEFGQGNDICELPPHSNVSIPVSPSDEEMPRSFSQGKYEILLEEAMSSEQVRIVLEMGYSRDMVERVIRNRMEYSNTTPTTQEILLGVWDLENEPSEERQDRSDDFRRRIDEHSGCAVPVNEVLPSGVSQQQGGATNEQVKYEELLEERKCKICMDKDRCILFQPCGHLVVCDTCSTKLKKCPLCRKQIRSAIRAYLS
ncbi:baculoviral IAP repeat-containing protein 7-like [Ptychodera flava]|uniref:baculoviral IAP repeat-containing protein 7-like n=1 Tax=Ptychodera flava TaxID=63121 RepID=UPI00396A89F7